MLEELGDEPVEAAIGENSYQVPLTSEAGYLQHPLIHRRHE
jgi:hypothetical protein